MKKLIAAAALVLALAACDSGDQQSDPAVTTTTGTTTPTAPVPAGSKKSDPPMVQAAFASLATTTDCTELQGRFDAAETGWSRNKASDTGDAFLRLMDQADKRMKQVGCYD